MNAENIQIRKKIPFSKWLNIYCNAKDFPVCYKYSYFDALYENLIYTHIPREIFFKLRAIILPFSQSCDVKLVSMHTLSQYI